MTRKEKITRLMAMRERKSAAQEAAVLAEHHLRMNQQQRLLETLQVLVQEKRHEIGDVTSVGQLAASHWMGTTLANQLSATEDHLRDTTDQVVTAKAKLARTTQRERVLVERADLHRRHAMSERQDKEDARLIEGRRR